MSINAYCRKLKVGWLVEVDWIDAFFSLDETGLSPDAILAGGLGLTTIGYICALSPGGICLASELDEKKVPYRDFNVLPWGMVKKVRVIKRSTIGEFEL